MKGIHFFAILCILSCFTLVSCILEDTGEYKLTGKIGQYITSDVCKVSCSTNTVQNGTTYLYATVENSKVLDNWGLFIRGIKYYVDDNYIAETNTGLTSFRDSIPNLSSGLHYLKCEITIGGESCEDALINRNASFSVTDNNGGTVVPGDNTTPLTDLFMDYNYVTSGDYLQINPFLFSEASSKPRITKVDYRWDGQLISSVNTEPFSLNYLITEAPETKHDIHVVVYYRNSDGTESTRQWYYSGYTICNDTDYRYTGGLKWFKESYTKADYLPVYARAYIGKNAKEKLEFRLLIDGEEVLMENSFPYDKNFPLASYETGVHVLTYKWTIIFEPTPPNISSSSASISSKKEFMIL